MKYVPAGINHNAKDKQTLDADINSLVEIILTKFGPQHQTCILIEEMAELIQVLCKIQRGTFDRDKLTEEFSHVMVSCEVIRQLMRIEPNDISAQVHEKLSEYLQT